MSKDRAMLESLGRDALIAEARARGVVRPDVMTRMEMVDEILRLTTVNPVERKKIRGFLGVARDLIAAVVDKGLHLPDAAAFIRGDVRYEPLRAPQPPVATVTLAEIYRAQGHYDRALATLDEVLDKEPDLEVARELRDRFAEELSRRPQKARPASEPPEPDLTKDPEDFGTELTASEAAVLDATPAPPTSVSQARAPVVAFTRSGPSTAIVYYDVPAAAAGETRVVRIVEMRPTSRGAERFEHELPCQGLQGAVTATNLERGSVVRAAVGSRAGEVFRPIAVAAEVEVQDGGWSVTWVPRRGVDRALLIQTVVSLSRAESSLSDAG